MKSGQLTAEQTHSFCVLSVCFFVQDAERGIRHHGGRVDYPLPQRSPGLRPAVGIRDEDGRSGETTDFL